MNTFLQYTLLVIVLPIAVGYTATYFLKHYISGNAQRSRAPMVRCASHRNAAS